MTGRISVDFGYGASDMEVSVRLVGSAAFKAVGTSDPRPAGSIPVHLRQFVRRRIRALVTCALGFFVVVPATGVLADPARPGNTESIVESVAPPAQGVRFDIVGSDAFMRVRVERGHELSATGYREEPFFKIDENGNVWVNDRSATLAVSARRYGAVEVVAGTASPTNVPEWRRVATNGSYVWHDHRVHWMSPSTPPTLNDKGLVQRWSIPFTVDGERVVVSGSVYLRSSPGSWWWLVSLPAVVAGMSLSARRRRGLVMVASVGIGVIGTAAYWGLPAAARPTPTLFVLGTAGLVIAGTAELVRRQREVSDALLASAGTALFVAIVLARRMVTHRFVPGLDDAWWIRTVIPMSAGVAVGATAASLRGLLGRN